MVRSLEVALALSMLSGCSTATLTFESSPKKAQIFAAPLGGALKLIGETPLTLKASDLPGQIGGSGPYLVEYRQPGRLPAKAFVTEMSASDLTINMDLPASTGLEEHEKLNSVIDRLFEAQHLGRAGRYDDALGKLKTLENESPQVSATYELQGDILYVQKKFRQALDAYNSALKYNPKNVEAARMRNQLLTTLNSGAPGAVNSSVDGAKK